jgi:formate-dependent nitrite reductase membrane component NrfD
MVSGYLVTKAIAGGIMMMAALMVVLGHANAQAAVGVVPPIVAGVMLVLTGGLLVGDLKQPKRFYFLLTKSNFDSWLVKGAYVLGVFAALSAVWLLLGAADAGDALKIVAIPTAILGATTAGYTAFLFGQCEGRDLWQTPLVLPMLLARAAIAGASAYVILDIFMDIPSHRAVWWVLLGGVGAIAFLSWVELQSCGSRHVEMAIHDMTRGAQKRWFQFGVILGLLLPATAMIIVLSNGDVSSTNTGIAAFAGLLALVGMFLSETAFVRAGQSVPLS